MLCAPRGERPKKSRIDPFSSTDRFDLDVMIDSDKFFGSGIILKWKQI
ncbi:hypothetical protein DICVIV_11882 [Dictyocaulus viviparus]|uniref:Uncharacterized protein n=1 Tax=Dictyocaulus viviparus TaxID=29172 RepID=A0A0D8XBX8_DICVI|nr:hypothetical protein DICVIV_11882 [Dictyocaulus viviparus]